jgi:MoaA/NifB/PqqE/SkfB family radical SAM enzyme
MAAKITIPILEYHLTNSCNLACESCSHYTNILKGNTKKPSDLEEHLLSWSKILDIKQFNILGGEPFLNKNIGEFCFIARSILPNSKILIYTNGLLLDKIKNIDAILQNIINNKIDIQVTIHSTSKNYSDDLKPNLEIFKYWKSLGINVMYKDGVTNWTKRYHTNIDGTISPFQDNDQEKSWNICPCKYCAILIDDKIYKCAPLAYLPEMKEINKTTPEFDQYLKYKPISYSESIEKIQEFFNRNYKSESFCSMCPSQTIKIKNKPI